MCGILVSTSRGLSSTTTNKVSESETRERATMNPDPPRTEGCGTCPACIRYEQVIHAYALIGIAKLEAYANGVRR